ncbi:MAG: hypothetical protein ACI9WC_001920 [Arenicella sp.]|jgi:hypothetical protein
MKTAKFLRLTVFNSDAFHCQAFLQATGNTELMLAKHEREKKRPTAKLSVFIIEVAGN